MSTGDTAENREMFNRSISMPVKAKHLDPRPLSRSPKHEKVNQDEVDYYPESPSLTRRCQAKQIPGDSTEMDSRSDQK